MDFHKLLCEEKARFRMARGDGVDVTSKIPTKLNIGGIGPSTVADINYPAFEFPARSDLHLLESYLVGGIPNVGQPFYLD
jgi:hypothetical protein